MPRIKVQGKWILYDSAKKLPRNSRIVGNENEEVFELERDFAPSLFIKVLIRPFDGSIVDRQLIKPSEVQ